MKHQYNGLEAMKIQMANNNVIAMSNEECVAMIQLLMVDGQCVSPEYQQQIEYVGDQG